MSTPNLLSQGVLMQDKQIYAPGSHIRDYNFFQSGVNKPVPIDDLGIVKTWAQMQRNVQPFYNFDQIAKTIVSVESDEGFKWKTCVAVENPTVVEDLSDSEKPGIDGQEFKIAFNKPFAVTNVITYDHINNQFQLIVAQEPYPDGDRWIHTLKIDGVSAKNAYLSKEFLTPGTQYYKITSKRGDNHDTVASHFQAEVGEREWTYRLSNAEIAKDFSIDKRSMLRLLAGEGANMDSKYRVTELYRFAPGSDGYKQMIGDPSINMSKIVNDVYKGDKNATKKDIIGRDWFMEIERLTMDQLMLEWTENLMWGTGGTTQIQFDTIQTSPGLYWQHRNFGTVVKYNFSTMSLDFIRTRIEAHFKHKVDFKATDEYMFKVGAGLFEFLQAEIGKENKALGLVYNVESSERFVQGDRFGLNATMRWNAFYLKAFPMVKITLVHEPALDPVRANDISNPIITRDYRLSSFTGIIYGLNDIEADNIKLVKWKYDDKLRYQKQIGTVDWADQNATFISSGDFSGVRGKMSLRHANMWLVDPTKSLMFELINPITGR